MTISTTARRAGPYAGNGVVVTFPFAFKIFNASDLLVQTTTGGANFTTLALTTNYTVTIYPNQDVSPGGSITCLVAPPVGTNLLILSNIPETQPTSLQNQGGMFPAVLNDTYDRCVSLIQQLTDRSLGFIRGQPGDVYNALPRKSDMAGRYLVGDVAGNLGPANPPDAVLATAPVTDIVALRAATWPTGRPTMVNLISLVTVGDDGALFRWDSGSTATDDSKTVIKETAVTTGRWLRQYIGLFNVERSAVRSEDYVSTSGTPAQQRANLQLAINEAISRGTWLQLQSGTIDVDTTSLTATAPIIIEGRSSKSTIRTTQDRGINPVIFASGDGVRLRDIRIESTFAGVPTVSSNNSAITFLNATGYEVEGVYLTGKFYVGLTSQASANGVVRDCTLTVTENRGIYLYFQNEDITINNNLIVGSNTLDYGININPGGTTIIKRIAITDNRIKDFEFHGIGVAENSQDVTLIGNKTETTVANSTCILLQLANTFYAGRTTIQGNTARGGSIGIYLTEAIRGSSVVGNIVEDQTGANPVGIYLSDVYYASVVGNYVRSTVGSSTGIYLAGSAADTCRRVSVSANQVLGPTNGIYAFANVVNATRDISIVGNGTFGCSGNGIIANADTDRVVMVGNNSRGNGTNLTNSGTNAVTADNMST
jgi:hypothetical protein